MPVTIKEDLISGASCTLDENGLTIVRAFTLKSLVGGRDIYLEVLTELRNQLSIDYDTQHPTASPAAYVTSIVPRGILKNKNAARAFVTYRTPDRTFSSPEQVIRFTSGSQETWTIYDHTGAPVRITYSAGPETPALTELAQVPTIKCRGLLEITRTENSVPQGIDLVGGLNTATWQGKPKWTWLIRDVSFEKIRFRPGYRTRYIIEFDPEGHWKTAVFVDRNTGRPPTDIVPVRSADGTGWKNVIPGGMFLLNFGTLDLPNVFG